MDPGLASAVAIMSGGFASTRLHFEDAWLGSSNVLLAGASKVCPWFQKGYAAVAQALLKISAGEQIWYIVADHHRDAFLASLPRHAKHAPGSKTFLPPQPSSADIAAGRIARIVQHPGELVVTQPVSKVSVQSLSHSSCLYDNMQFVQGQTLHWTISCGANICESSNFYLPIAADDTDFADNGTDFDTNSRRCINALSRCHGKATSNAIRCYLADRANNANIVRHQMDLLNVVF